MTLRWTGIAILAVVISTTACLGRSPNPERYMLGTDGAGTAGDAAPEIALLVGPVRLPAYLDRPQFARLEGPGEIELDEFARWLGGFEENFLRALSLDLARRTGSIRIAATPSKAPFPFDARIRLHVDDLVVDGDVLRTRIRWRGPDRRSRGGGRRRDGGADSDRRGRKFRDRRGLRRRHRAPRRTDRGRAARLIGLAPGARAASSLPVAAATAGCMRPAPRSR